MCPRRVTVGRWDGGTGNKRATQPVLRFFADSTRLPEVTAISMSSLRLAAAVATLK